MENLKKLSRNNLKTIEGGTLQASFDISAANDCHVHYAKNPDGSKGKILSSGTGPCHAKAGQICETYSSGSDGKCY